MSDFALPVTCYAHWAKRRIPHTTQHDRFSRFRTGRPLQTRFVVVSLRECGLGREPINLPVGRLARVRYAPMATEFRSTAK